MCAAVNFLKARNHGNILLLFIVCLFQGEKVLCCSVLIVAARGDVSGLSVVAMTTAEKQMRRRDLLPDRKFRMRFGRVSLELFKF